MTTLADDSVLVLLVEDNPEHRSMVREFLFENQTFSPRKYKLVEAVTLGEGEQALKVHLPESKISEKAVLLLDLELPDSSKEETLNKIKSFSDAIPVIVLTSCPESELGEKALSLGAQDFLPKSQLTAPLLDRSIRYSLERIQQVRKLKRMNEEMQISNDELREFGKIVKHEILESLVSLRAYRRIADSESGGDARLVGIVDQTLSAITNLEVVTNQAFKYANVGFFPLPTSSCDMNYLFDNLTEATETDAELGGYIKIDRRDFIPPVEGHMPRLQRGIVSLLGVFRSKSEKTPQTVVVELKESGSSVVITLSGKSTIIPEESGRHAFFVFRKLFSASVGVSLYVAQQCLERLHGELWTETSAQKGLKIYIKLPAAL